MSNFTQIVLPVGRVTPQGIELLGTSFFVTSDGRLATTRHVIGDDDKNLCVLYPKIADLNAYQDTSDTSCDSFPVTVEEIDPIRDLAILKSQLLLQGTLPTLGSFDDVNVAEEVGILGYPHAPDGRRVLTLQTTIIGAKLLLESSGIKGKHAIVNTQARPGQSGSLIYAHRQQKIVGILMGAFAPGSGGLKLGNIDPRELHQTTHCLSAEYIQEMI